MMMEKILYKLRVATLLFLFSSPAVFASTYEDVYPSVPSGDYYDSQEGIDGGFSTLPNDQFYTEDFGVLGVDPDDNLDPGGSGTGDGGFVGAPVGDGIIPVIVAISLYSLLVFVKKKKQREEFKI